MQNLKYDHVAVTLQEIPDEISLTFVMCGCTLKCRGCHSTNLWTTENGTELTDELLTDFLSKYAGKATNILFMGGDWNPVDLTAKLAKCINAGFKTALYTGLTVAELVKRAPHVLEMLDYLKTGRWDPSRGGLDSPSTNQILVNLKTGENLNYKFQKH